MAFTMLVGLNVLDDGAYQSYREAMGPVLARYGGGFGYDFKVAEVLKSEVEAPMNRVFTIYFESEAAKDLFFSDEAYLEVKRRYFEGAVSDTTIIATYER